jgi:hypothetical protein
MDRLSRRGWNAPFQRSVNSYGVNPTLAVGASQVEAGAAAVAYPVVCGKSKPLCSKLCSNFTTEREISRYFNMLFDGFES